jgi:hypothetical protein
MRFRHVLSNALIEIGLGQLPRKDSPVYTFLRELNPPALVAAVQGVAPRAAEIGENQPEPGRTRSLLMQQVDEANQRAIV